MAEDRRKSTCGEEVSSGPTAQRTLGASGCRFTDTCLRVLLPALSLWHLVDALLWKVFSRLALVGRICRFLRLLENSLIMHLLRICSRIRRPPATPWSGAASTALDYASRRAPHGRCPFGSDLRMRGLNEERGDLLAPSPVPA